MAFFQLESQQIAEQGHGHEYGDHVGHASVRKFPADDYPQDVEDEDYGVKNKRWRKDVVYRDPQGFLAVYPDSFLGHERAAEQGDYSKSYESVGVGEPVVGQVEVEQESY